MNLIDTHCHLDVAEFDADRDAVYAQCQAAGIKQIIVPAIQQSGWQQLLTTCQHYAGLYPALGLHPVFIEQHQDNHLPQLREQIELHQPVAVGEIGLDFYLKELDQQRQLTMFEAQLQVAKDFDLPVLLHVRKAHEPVLSLLKKYKLCGGIAHAFNGSEQQARQYIELGFKLGFGGTLTYTGSKKIHQLARQLPLESIVLETDAPDMVVAQHRGERNSPAYLLDCLKALARLRDISEEAVAAQTTTNAHQVLRLN